MAERSSLFVIAALVANAAIAAVKLLAAAVTGSSAMLSEGIHSLVDTGDSGLLLLGRHRSRRAPDQLHPFGHGKELYFWTIVVAVLVFALGGGMSLYEGILHLIRPEPAKNLVWSYTVLGVSGALDLGSWVFGFRELRRHRRGRGILQTASRIKDPTVLSVILEDTADVIGISLAFLGILLGQLLGEPRLDGIASVAIGLLLMAVAVGLAGATMSLVIGAAADPDIVARAQSIIRGEPAVRNVARVMTVHFGPDAVVLAAEVAFQPEGSSAGVALAIRRVEQRLRSEIPQLQAVFIEAQSIAAAVGGA